MARTKLDDRKRARLEQVAWLKAQTPLMRHLATELGFTELYTRRVVSTMVRKIRAQAQTHKRDEVFPKFCSQNRGS